MRHSLEMLWRQAAAVVSWPAAEAAAAEAAAAEVEVEVAAAAGVGVVLQTPDLK